MTDLAQFVKELTEEKRKRKMLVTEFAKLDYYSTQSNSLTDEVLMPPVEDTPEVT